MFILIPEKVDSDTTIHSNSKRLMGHIISLNKGSLGCIAKNDYLAAKLQVHERTITRYIKELKDNGYIKVENINVGSKNSIIRVMLPSIKILSSMEDVGISLKTKVSKWEKKQLPEDITSSWLDDYISNLE